MEHMDDTEVTAQVHDRARQTHRTVGRLAEQLDLTVRTLHHYDEIGLLRPSERSSAGYRLYTDADVVRLQHVVVYRRLGFSLEEIADLLAQPDRLVEHLRRQRDAVHDRLDELQGLVVALDTALAREENDMQITPQEQKELFGEHFSEEYAEEAEQRWGDTDKWRQSQQRTAAYTKADWEQVKAEADALNEAFVAARAQGPADSDAAMDAAEAHKRHIEERFYDLDHAFHRCLGDTYVDDERWRATYDAVQPGLAQYVRDAIHANADRHA